MDKRGFLRLVDVTKKRSEPVRKLALHWQKKGFSTEECENELSKVEECELVTSVNLSKNNLTSCPEGLRRFKSLRVLSLSANKLVELPVWIGEFAKLELLYADRNKLTSVPIGIFQLRNLSSLYLTENSRLLKCADFFYDFKGVQTMLPVMGRHSVCICARRAIMAWSIIARRNGVVKDIRILIGRLVWEDRYTSRYEGIDASKLSRK